MNYNINVHNSNNKYSVMSPIQYIGNNHPYFIFYIINLCICSSLFISNYTLAKTSILLYIITILNNNIFIIIIILFFIVYPLLFIILIHPYIIKSIEHSLLSKSQWKGVILDNIISVIMLFISFLNLYIFFILFLLPFLSILKYVTN